MLKYSENLPFGLELIGDSVVKKTGQFNRESSLHQMKRIVNHFIHNPDPLVVPVYEWFGDDKKSAGYYEYSYTMKRLFILSQEEKAIVDCSYYFYKEINLPSKYSVNIIEQAKINHPELIKFCKQVVTEERYWDFHMGNVLKDELGDYKLIDLEGFARDNIDWIP